MDDLVGFDPSNPDLWLWFAALLDENGDPILDDEGVPIIIPVDSFGGGNSSASSRPRQFTGRAERLPQIQRRGAPAAYTWRAEQIRRNNELATRIAKAVAEALTADE